MSTAILRSVVPLQEANSRRERSPRHRERQQVQRVDREDEQVDGDREQQRGLRVDGADRPEPPESRTSRVLRPARVPVRLHEGETRRSPRPWGSSLLRTPCRRQERVLRAGAHLPLGLASARGLVTAVVVACLAESSTRQSPGETEERAALLGFLRQ